MLVADPAGRRWVVRRRWLHVELPRWRGPRDVDFSSPLDAVDEPSGIFAVIGLVLAAIVLVIVAVPAVIFGGELVLVLTIALAGFAGRLLFGRPWTVQARCDDGRHVERQVAGYRNAGAELDELRRQIELGSVPDSRPALATTPARRGWEAATAIVVALLWAAGAGSIVALVMAARIRRAPESGPKARAAAWVATALGVAGLLLLLLIVAGAISEHQRVG